jgi:hypothetical protein
MNTTERVVRLDTLFFFKPSPPASATDCHIVLSHFPSFFHMDLELFTKINLRVDSAVRNTVFASLDHTANALPHSVGLETIHTMALPCAVSDGMDSGKSLLSSYHKSADETRTEILQ